MAISALIPIYLLVCAGFILVKSGYIAKDIIRPANTLIVKAFVPVVIFLAIYRMAGSGNFDWGFIFGYGAASLAVMLISMGILRSVFQVKKDKAALFSLASAGSNSIFIGFPLAMILFADLADLSLSWVLIVENLLIIPLSLWLYDWFSEAGGGKAALKNMLKNPILLAIILGLILPFFVPKLWTPLEQAMQMVRNATGGVSLVLIGGMLARARLTSRLPAVFFLVFGKLVLHPLAVLSAFWLLGISGAVMICAVAYASISCFGIYANFLEMADEGEFGASVFLLSTMLAPMTISFWLYIANLL